MYSLDRDDFANAKDCFKVIGILATGTGATVNVENSKYIIALVVRIINPKQLVNRAWSPTLRARRTIGSGVSCEIHV